MKKTKMRKIALLLLALRLLAVLSAELPPSQVVNPLFDALPQVLTSTNQFERRAGLLAIGVSSAGAPDFISPNSKNYPINC